MLAAARRLSRASLAALSLLPACSRGDRGRRDGRQGEAPAPHASGLVASKDGASVHDRARDVTWLADLNLAAKRPFGVEGIERSGAMDYKTALAWIAALNEARHLGHDDWQLPSTPPEDPGCGSHNRYAFGFGCRKSMFGSLYYGGLGLAWPEPAVSLPSPPARGGFVGFQPYLYWSATGNANHEENENGYTTFSFCNGFLGSNVTKNFAYVIPMVKGRVDEPRGRRARTVYDPDADVTWLADANLAATESFGVSGIAKSGAMRHDTAVAWVKAMNAADHGAGYLGRNDWELPPSVQPDESCSAKSFGFRCTGSPLGRLYYGLLGLKAGEPVTKVPDLGAGPLHHVQPYLYWSCHAARDGRCSDDASLPVKGFAWSFSLGNGFQGTTTTRNLLYVAAVHPGPP